MHNHHLIRSLSILGVLAAAGASQAVILATWTFETSAPTTTGPHSAEIGSGQAMGNHASGSTVFSSPAGNGSAKSFSSNVWTIGDNYQFKTSTIGMQNVTLAFDQTSSGTGPRDFQVQWSTDGSTFTNFGSVYVVLVNGGTPNPSWNSVTPSSAYGYSFNLSSITALNNQANIYLRLTLTSNAAANGGNLATTGTDRVDNVSISATAVPEPASLAMVGMGVAALLRRRRK